MGPYPFNHFTDFTTTSVDIESPENRKLTEEYRSNLFMNELFQTLKTVDDLAKQEAKQKKLEILEIALRIQKHEHIAQKVRLIIDEIKGESPVSEDS